MSGHLLDGDCLQPAAFLGAVCLHAKLADFFRSFEDRLEHGFERNALRSAKRKPPISGEEALKKVAKDSRQIAEGLAAECVVQQPIESVKLVVKGLVLRDRAVAHGLKRGHGLLSGTEVGKPSCLNPPAGQQRPQSPTYKPGWEKTALHRLFAIGSNSLETRVNPSANSPSGLCGRQAVPHARPRGALSRSGAPVRPTRRGREPLWLARPRHSLRPSWSSHQVACARAAIHLASIQMGEHAQFGPLDGGSVPGLTVALRSFPPVNS
jgi:hypothetical protein